MARRTFICLLCVILVYSAHALELSDKVMRMLDTEDYPVSSISDNQQQASLGRLLLKRPTSDWRPDSWPLDEGFLTADTNDIFRRMVDKRAAMVRLLRSSPSLAKLMPPEEAIKSDNTKRNGQMVRLL